MSGGDIGATGATEETVNQNLEERKQAKRTSSVGMGSGPGGISTVGPGSPPASPPVELQP